MRLRPRRSRKHIFGAFRAHGTCLVAANVVLFLSNVEIEANVIDKRLFQCGSQEAGLVKYDKYTCKNEQ